jgi:hypothetical protein
MKRPSDRDRKPTLIKTLNLFIFNYITKNDTKTKFKNGDHFNFLKFCNIYSKSHISYFIKYDILDEVLDEKKHIIISAVILFLKETFILNFFFVTIIDFNKNCIDLNIKLVPIQFFHSLYCLLSFYFCTFLVLLLYYLVFLLYCLICYSLRKFYDYSYTRLIASALWLYNNFIFIFFTAGIEICLLRWFVFIIYLLCFLMDLVFI